MKKIFIIKMTETDIWKKRFRKQIIAHVKLKIY